MNRRIMMDIEKHFRSLRYGLLVAALLGAGIALTGCIAAAAPVVVPMVDCPVADTVEPVPFDVLWESSAHADDEAEAFRHWDAEDPQEIPVECAGCHSRTGFLDYLGVDGSPVEVVDSPAKIGTTITCYVCHNEATYELDSATFPSGVRIGGLGPEARCITCHKGRGSTQTLNILITKANPVDDDTPIPDLEFLSSHSTSAATSFGSEVQGAYEYSGKIYRGRFNRGDDFFACTRCHDQHSLEVKVESCIACHSFDGEDVKNIRVNATDMDGDGDVAEGVAFEIEQLQTNLYAAIQNYARDVIGTPIAYDLAFYPYFFIDTDGNGLVDPEEAKFENKYNSWSPRLLRAAYNYNYVQHDAGAFAHNSEYTLQVLYDSLEDVGAEVSGLERP